MKSVMKKLEDRNNDAKEEMLEFGTSEGSRVCVVGSCC